jgi:hypothetical protein
MGTIVNILEDWASSHPSKASVYASEPAVIVSWVNAAQLQFCDRSECLRGVWEPTITSTGNIALPSNFLREIKDRVKWDSNTYLRQIDYPTANLVDSWSSTTNYSIWGSTFYVWSPAAGSPVIPYIKKPTAITVSTLASSDFEIPTEYQHTLKLYFNAMMAERKDDIAGSIALMQTFDSYCGKAYMDIVRKVDPVPFMRGGFF